MEIVLHHYATSPFSELVRLALGLKGLAWKSVDIPVVSPKPDLTALTGGYERTPVLQIGADIYCDTAIIVDALESYKPAPSLFPAPLGKAGRFIGLWAGGPAFIPAVGAALGSAPEGALPPEFWADREKRFGLSRDRFLPMAPHLTAQFEAGLAHLADALADERTFIGGEAPGYADLALYMNVWFQAMRGQQPRAYGKLIEAWSARVAALGHGASKTWSGAEAIAHAAEETPAAIDIGVDPASGFALGQPVAVRTETPDPAAVKGTLAGLDKTRIVIARHDARAGDVRVHLPRLGQLLLPDG